MCGMCGMCGVCGLLIFTRGGPENIEYGAIFLSILVVFVFFKNFLRTFYVWKHVLVHLLVTCQ